MPLPTGMWKVNVNGKVGTLTVDSVDAQGNVIGTTTFGALKNFWGFWDEDSQKLTFVGTFVSQFSEHFVFTGCLFQDAISITGVAGGTIFTLAGYCAGTAAAELFGGTTRKPQLGWYAQIGVE